MGCGTVAPVAAETEYINEGYPFQSIVGLIVVLIVIMFLCGIFNGGLFGGVGGGY